MRGTVLLSDGGEAVLPEALSWTVKRTDGTACDSFHYCFPYTADWEGILKKAVRFRGTASGETRIYGVVDEYQVTLSSQGLQAEVFGRGMAGLLMDNQVRRMEYGWVRLSDILRNYVTPYGIPFQYDSDYSLSGYAVEYGTSAWQALEGFCLWAGEIQPRFQADGTLVISGREGERVQQPERLLKAEWDCCRYGVYSQVTAQYAATGVETAVVNQAFQNLGGQAVKRMTIPKKNSCRASSISPSLTLRQSAAKARTLTLTAPGAFLAAPGDILPVKLERFGIQGDFLVTAAESSQTAASGTVCRLTAAWKE